MNGVPALERLKMTLGGKIFPPTVVKGSGRLTTSRWTPTNLSVGSHAGEGHKPKKAFLEGMLPYLVLKKRQAELAVAFLDDRLAHRAGDPISETTFLMYEQLTAMIVAEKDLWRYVPTTSAETTSVSELESQ